MENTASQPSCSCISRKASMSAGESSWAMHFACFLQASSPHRLDMDRWGGGVSVSSFSSGFSSSLDSFITSDMVRDADADEDDSLQDTACSYSGRPKAKYFIDASSRQKAIQEVISGGNNSEKQLHESNDLRKRGLCLVPLSMLIDYLG